MNAVFWLGINGFNSNILLTFQAVKNLSAYPIISTFCFVILLVIFWYIWG